MRFMKQTWLKLLRQDFSKAVVAGTRSDSGKLVCDHYEQLIQIWGGSPSTEPLNCGIDTTKVNDQNSDDESYDADVSKTDDQQPSDTSLNNEQVESTNQDIVDL